MSAWLFTTEIPLYLPSVIDRLLDEHAEQFDRVVLVELPLEYLLRAHYRMYGPIDGLRIGARFVRGSLLGLLSPEHQRNLTGQLHSVRAAAERHDVPAEAVSDVTDSDFVDRVGAADPELLLSLICGQRLGADLLDVPDWAINLHPSLLPDYRGPAPEFWALYHDEDETGWTAHVMTERFDAGPIVDQRALEIADDDTLHTLTHRLGDIGTEFVSDLLGRFPDPEFETRPNPATEEDYYPMPSADDRREFKRRGNRLL